jgi:hypothetical protein
MVSEKGARERERTSCLVWNKLFGVEMRNKLFGVEMRNKLFEVG